MCARAVAAALCRRAERDVHSDRAGAATASSTSKLKIDQPKPLMRRCRAVAPQLFRTKSADHLIAEAAAPERQMKRALGPSALTCIGIGAILGPGLFALAGTAAAREEAQVLGSSWEPPALN